jgi:hypothetical protein
MYEKSQTGSADPKRCALWREHSIVASVYAIDIMIKSLFLNF